MATNGKVLSFETPDPPYENYFYADSNVSVQVILASPLRKSPANDASIHRILFAWPAGNSGAVLFFMPTDDVTGGDDLKLTLQRQQSGRYLTAAVQAPAKDSANQHDHVGVKAILNVSRRATLSLAVLGSLRTVRDYTEGGGLLNEAVQDGVQFSPLENGAEVKRTWFDGATTTALRFEELGGNGKPQVDVGNGTTAIFGSGSYQVTATVNYPHAPSLPPTLLLKPEYHGLIERYANEVASLAFLITSEKFLAGAWRFFTYFGRDTLITLLLMEEILSETVVEVG